MSSKCLILLVRPERFELPTYGFVVRRSIQLSYERTNKNKAQGAAAVAQGYGGQEALGAVEIPPNLPLRKGGVTPLWERGDRGDFISLLVIYIHSCKQLILQNITKTSYCIN